MKHYVYYLKDASGQVRYVGVTTEPQRRLGEHRSSDYFRVTGSRYAQWKSGWVDYPTLDVVCVLETLEEGLRVEASLIERLKAQGVPLVNGSEEERREKIRQANYLRTDEFKANVGRTISKALQALPIEQRAGGARTPEGIQAHNDNCRKTWTPEKRAEFGRQQRARLARKRNEG